MNKEGINRAILQLHASGRGDFAEHIEAALAEKDREIARLRRERDCAEARVERLEEALDDLLDGLNANADERCGLTTEQWDKRVKNARAALEDLEDKKPDGPPF